MTFDIFFLNPDKCEVEAGMQATTKVFITHAAHVFLSEPPGHEERQIREQVSICETVLNMYKNIVMKVKMNKDTWWVYDIEKNVNPRYL